MGQFGRHQFKRMKLGAAQATRKRTDGAAQACRRPVTAGHRNSIAGHAMTAVRAR